MEPDPMLERSLALGQPGRSSSVPPVAVSIRSCASQVFVIRECKLSLLTYAFAERAWNEGRLESPWDHISYFREHLAQQLRPSDFITTKSPWGEEEK